MSYNGPCPKGMKAMPSPPPPPKKPEAPGIVTIRDGQLSEKRSGESQFWGGLLLGWLFGMRALLVSAIVLVGAARSAEPTLHESSKEWHVEGVDADGERRGEPRDGDTWKFSIYHGSVHRNGLPVFSVWATYSRKDRHGFHRTAGGMWVADFRQYNHAQAFCKRANESTEASER